MIAEKEDVAMAYEDVDTEMAYNHQRKSIKDRHGEDDHGE